MDYFRTWIEKIRATKKFAREKNVPVWEIPLANSVGIIILTAVYMSVYTWIVIVDVENNMQYIPYWWTSFIEIANFLPLIYLSILCWTMLDKVLKVFIIFQAEVTKSIYAGIQKVDHKIWRKTGKDSVIANKIWRVQQAWLKIDKKKRRKIKICAIILAILFYGFRIFG
tara:strand:+ start:239 stop:745 length:507 start_codon:yes stop_codon:yes gene_type:complete